MDQNPYQSPAKEEPTKSDPAVRSRANGPELFGVVVRGIGLYFILTGMSHLAYGIFLLRGAIPAVPGPDGWKIGRMAFEWMVPGIIAFFFADFVVGLAYRDELPCEKPEPTGGDHVDS